MDARILCLILAVVVLQGTEITDGAPPQLLLKYACQGNKMRLRCKHNDMIVIYSAEYGRTDIDSICVDPNKVQRFCSSNSATLKIATDRCTHRARCNLKADNTMFPDPCPDVYKYLSVSYVCVKRPAHVTTRPPSTRKRRRSTTPLPTQPITTTPQPTTTTTPTTTTPPTTNITYLNTTQNITTTSATFITSRVTEVDSKIILTDTDEVSSFTTSPKPTKEALASGYKSQGEVVMSTVVSFFLTYIILSGQPKYVLILFLSGVAIATVLLLVLLLGLHIRGRRSKKLEIQTDKPLSPDPSHHEDDEDDGVHDGDDDDDTDDETKNITVEVQGGNEETKQISVKPGDIIIIDSKELENDDSEDLGYMSEIVRYYNSRNLVHDDGKQSLTCESPSVNSIPNSDSDKRELQYETVRPANGVCVI